MKSAISISDLQSVSDYFAGYVSLDEKEILFLESQFKTVYADDGDYILRQGEISQQILFIQQGLLVMVYERSDKVIVKDFIFEHNFATAYESYLSREPARYALKAFGPCVYQIITKKKLGELYKRIPSIQAMTRKLTENIYLNISQRFESLITLSTEDRYLELLDKRPRLMQEVPQYMIASYLGVTDVTLSRIRRKLSQRA